MSEHSIEINTAGTGEETEGERVQQQQVAADNTVINRPNPHDPQQTVGTEQKVPEVDVTNRNNQAVTDTTVNPNAGLPVLEDPDKVRAVGGAANPLQFQLNPRVDTELHKLLEHERVQHQLEREKSKELERQLTELVKRMSVYETSHPVQQPIGIAGQNANFPSAFTSTVSGDTYKPEPIKLTIIDSANVIENHIRAKIQSVQQPTYTQAGTTFPTPRQSYAKPEHEPLTVDQTQDVLDSIITTDIANTLKARDVFVLPSELINDVQVKKMYAVSSAKTFNITSFPILKTTALNDFRAWSLQLENQAIQQSVAPFIFCTVDTSFSQFMYTKIHATTVRKAIVDYITIMQNVSGYLKQALGNLLPLHLTNELQERQAALNNPKVLIDNNARLLYVKIEQMCSYQSAFAATIEVDKFNQWKANYRQTPEENFNTFMTLIKNCDLAGMPIPERQQKAKFLEGLMTINAFQINRAHFLTQDERQYSINSICNVYRSSVELAKTDSYKKGQNRTQNNDAMYASNKQQQSSTSTYQQNNRNQRGKRGGFRGRGRFRRYNNNNNNSTRENYNNQSNIVAHVEEDNISLHQDEEYEDEVNCINDEDIYDDEEYEDEHIIAYCHDNDEGINCAAKEEISDAYELDDEELLDDDQTFYYSNGNYPRLDERTPIMTEYLFDSASSLHISNNDKHLVEKYRTAGKHSISSITGSSMPYNVMGKLIITKNLSLGNVAYAPQATKSIISIPRLCDAGLTVVFTKSTCYVTKNRVTVGDYICKGDRVNGAWAHKVFKGIYYQEPISKPSESTFKRAEEQAIQESKSNTRETRQALEQAREARRSIPKKSNQPQQQQAPIQTAPIAASTSFAFGCFDSNSNNSTIQSEDACLFNRNHTTQTYGNSDLGNKRYDHNVPLVGKTIEPELHHDKTLIKNLTKEHSKNISKPASTSIENILKLHIQLAHPSFNTLLQTISQYHLNISAQEIESFKKYVCPVCISSKAKNTNVSKQRKPIKASLQPLERIVADTIGPMSFNISGVQSNVRSLGGSLYATILTDAATKYSIPILCPTKDVIPGEIVNQLKRIQRITGHNIKFFHSDNGTEFVNQELTEYLTSVGITHTKSVIYTPALNGLAEVTNRLVLEGTTSLLLTSNSPPELWAEALSHFINIRNNTPLPSLQYKIPFSLLFNKLFNIMKLHIFGSDCYLHKLSKDRNKLESRTTNCVYLGFDYPRKAHRVIDCSNGKVYVNKNVTINNNCFSHMSKLYQFLYPSMSSESMEQRKITLPQTIIELEDAISPITNLNTKPINVMSHTSVENNTPTPESEISPIEVDNEINPIVQPQTINVNQHPIISPTTSEHEPDSTQDISFDHLEHEHESLSPISETEEQDISPEPEDSLQPRQPIAEPAIEVLPGITTIPRTVVRRSTRTVTAPFYLGRPDPKDYEQPQRRPRTSKRQALLCENITDKGQEVNTDLTLLAQKFKRKPSKTITLNNKILYEPSTYNQAINCVDKDKWLASMRQEYDSFITQKVFTEVERTPEMKLIDSKWVYKIKLNDQNEISKFKSRIVARGFEQVCGINYTDIFAPVAKHKSLKFILSVTAAKDNELCQLDIVTAFLQSNIDTDIFMVPPPGYQHGNKVWKLKKSVYGLKQSPRNWNMEVSSFLEKLGYKSCKQDSCLLIKHTSNGIIYMSVYVDDITVSFSKEDSEIWNKDKQSILSKYQGTDLGQCTYILNMKISRNKKDKLLFLSQSNYVDKILAELEMSNNMKAVHNPATADDMTTPLDNTTPRQLNTQEHKRFRQIIGKLSYIAQTTRPDIAYSVNLLTHYLAQPYHHHLTASIKILKYLNIHKDNCLVFGKHSYNDINQMHIKVYSDANYANAKDRKSISGIILLLNNDIICWQTKKQSIIALSTAEAELYAATEAIKDALWLQNMLQEIYNIIVPITMYIDNLATISIIENNTDYGKSKHINIRFKYVKNYLSNNHINIKWVESKNNIADILTKRMANPAFESIRDQLLADHEQID